MRKILCFLLVFILASSFFCCKKEPLKESSIEISEAPKNRIKIHERIEERSDTPSIALCPDTLAGIFDGKTKDLLISEPIPESYVPIQKLNEESYDIYTGWFYKWRVFTQKGTVKEKIVDNTIGITFVKEGDVDGDGKNEWGYITKWPTSSWMRYHVYKNYNGTWEYMIEPTTIWLGHIGEEENEIAPEEIIQRSEKKGFVKVKFSDVRNEGADFLIIDTLIRINNRLQ